MNDDYLTVLVWILRMVLPCILFWISFGPRIRTLWQHPSVAKSVMLAHREIVKSFGEGAPEAVSNLMMVDATQAPMLFQERRPRPEQAERGGERGDRRDERRDGGERGDRRDRDRGDRNERGERGDRPRRDSEPRRDRKRPPSPPPVEEDPQPTEAELEEERKQQAAE